MSKEHASHSAEHGTDTLKALIDRQFAGLTFESSEYGERFARTFRPVIQEGFEGMRSLMSDIRIDRIDEFTDLQRGLVGGAGDFVREMIERPSYLAGIYGHPEWPFFDEAQEPELHLSTEALENNATRAPYPENSPYCSFWLFQFNEFQLARLSAFWYKMGAIDRLDGTLESRRQDYEIETAALQADMRDIMMGRSALIVDVVLAESSEGESVSSNDEDDDDYYADYDNDGYDDEPVSIMDIAQGTADEFYDAIVAGAYTADHLAQDAWLRIGHRGTPNGEMQDLACEIVNDIIRRENGESSSPSVSDT